MNKHTPGPRVIDGKSVGPKYSNELAVCEIENIDVGGEKGWFYGSQTQANARLIAAAPDLLEALECVEQETMLLAQMKNCELRRGKGSFGIAVMGDELALEWQEYNKIRRALEDKRFAVIAKARGEA